jgi:hypothetical protein
VTNPGTTDYWVANSRVGSFHTRYAKNMGTVNTLKYGSKLLYTNEDWSVAVPANSPVKVGGMEVMIEGTGTAYMLTLNEPYLGASIIPVLADSGSMAESIASTAMTMVTGKLGQITTSNVNEFKLGKNLYINGCPIVSDDSTVVADDATVSVLLVS